MRLFILVCVLFHTAGCFAQSNYADSLDAALKNPKITVAERIVMLGKAAYQVAEQKDTVRTIRYTDELIGLAQKNNNADGIIQGYKILGTMKVARSKISEGIVYFEKQLLLAQKSKNESAEMEANISLGRAYGLIKNLPESINALEKATVLAKKNNEIKAEAIIKSNLSSIYINMGKTDQALKYAIEAIKVAEKINNFDILGASANSVAKMLNESKRYDESIEYSTKAIKIFEKLKPQRNLVVSYINLGNSYAEKVNYDEAHRYYEKGLQASEEIGLIPGIQICINNMASISLRKGQFQQAITEYEKVLAIAEKNKQANGMGIVYQNLGLAYTRSKQFEKALPFFQKSEDIKTLTIAEKIELYSHRAEYDSAVGDFRSAYIYQAKFKRMQDSLINDRRNKDLSEIKTKYETEKKEQQITILNVQNQLQFADLEKNKLDLKNKELLVKEKDLKLEGQLLVLENQKLEITTKDISLKATSLENEKNEQKVKILDVENQLKKTTLDKQNIWLGIIGGAFLLTCLLGYLLFNRRQLQQEAKLQAEVSRQQELATQAVLDAEERERKRISSDLHDGVGQTIMALKMNLMGIHDYIDFKNEKARTVFENALSLATDSAKEVRSISHQMMPNALLKSGLASALREFISKVEANQLKINLSVNNLTQSIDGTIEKVLYRVIQESVNNVVKHAQASELNIQLSKTDKSIEATIEDNGVGFDTKETDYEGIGIKNIRDRVVFLKGSVDISSQKGRGTLLAISIPITN